MVSPKGTGQCSALHAVAPKAHLQQCASQALSAVGLQQRWRNYKAIIGPARALFTVWLAQVFWGSIKSRFKDGWVGGRIN